MDSLDDTYVSQARLFLIIPNAIIIFIYFLYDIGAIFSVTTIAWYAQYVCDAKSQYPALFTYAPSVLLRIH